jgi:acyl-CoA thioesterase-2
MTGTAPDPQTGALSALDLLELADNADGTFSPVHLSTDERVYGGLTAAQATLAACRTVADGFVPHSVQVSFVHAGRGGEPVDYTVERDRDGRSFATRTVTARQSGRLLARVLVSFQLPEDGIDHAVGGPPVVGDPDATRSFAVPRLASFEGRLPIGDVATVDWPSRFWVRCTAPFDVDDAVMQAVLLVYLSDTSTGLAELRDDDWAYGPTLNHTIWLQRPSELQNWMLFALHPQTVAGGRGWYTGTISDEAGSVRASLAQETLFRRAERHGRTPWLPVV